jgi:hypothetical protein
LFVIYVACLIKGVPGLRVFCFAWSGGVGSMAGGFVGPVGLLAWVVGLYRSLFN